MEQYGVRIWGKERKKRTETQGALCSLTEKSASSYSNDVIPSPQSTPLLLSRLLLPASVPHTHRRIYDDTHATL